MLWAGLPLVHDDPSDLKQMKSMIMTAFGGQVIGSSCLAMSASTVPLVWANKPCHKRKTSIYIDTRIQPNLMYGMGVELLPFLSRYISSCLLIPFLNKIEFNLAEVEEVNRLNTTLINALPDILSMGRR